MSDLIPDNEVINTPLGPMLKRVPAGKYLKAKYHIASPAFLAKAATLGIGPPFHKVLGGKGSLYPIASLDEWALAQFGEARPSFMKEAS